MWTISNFNQKLEEAKEAKTQIQSPYFYTSESGYKLQVFTLVKQYFILVTFNHSYLQLIRFLPTHNRTVVLSRVVQCRELFLIQYINVIQRIFIQCTQFMVFIEVLEAVTVR